MQIGWSYTRFFGSDLAGDIEKTSKILLTIPEPQHLDVT